MSVLVNFQAVVGNWSAEDQDAVFAALTAWAYEDEKFSEDDVCVDIVGGGPRNPIVTMMAYSMTRLWVTLGWAVAAEARLRQRVEPAGGSSVRLEIEYPPEEYPEQE